MRGVLARLVLALAAWIERRRAPSVARYAVTHRPPSGAVTTHKEPTP